jgi:hypothetical protein
MVMGFILPFALTFVAIPLESFIHSSRTVLGVVFVAFLKGVTFLLRLIGNFAKSMGAMIVGVYDLVIFGPLWLEGIIKTREPRDKSEDTKSIESTKEEAII